MSDKQYFFLQLFRNNQEIKFPFSARCRLFAILECLQHLHPAMTRMTIEVDSWRIVRCDRTAIRKNHDAVPNRCLRRVASLPRRGGAWARAGTCRRIGRSRNPFSAPEEPDWELWTAPMLRLTNNWTLGLSYLIAMQKPLTARTTRKIPGGLYPHCGTRSSSKIRVGHERASGETHWRTQRRRNEPLRLPSRRSLRR